MTQALTRLTLDIAVGEGRAIVESQDAPHRGERISDAWVVSLLNRKGEPPKVEGRLTMEDRLDLHHTRTVDEVEWRRRVAENKRRGWPENAIPCADCEASGWRGEHAPLQKCPTCSGKGYNQPTVPLRTRDVLAVGSAPAFTPRVVGTVPAMEVSGRYRARVTAARDEYVTHFVVGHRRKDGTIEPVFAGEFDKPSPIFEGHQFSVGFTIAPSRTLADRRAGSDLPGTPSSRRTLPAGDLPRSD